MKKKLQDVCAAFRIEGELESYENIKVGNVNGTYQVMVRKADGQLQSYMVQKVNTYVFRKPVEVMENIGNVTRYIRRHKDSGEALRFFCTAEGTNYLFDENGFWRLFNYIPSATYNVTTDMEIIRNCGEAFGEFQMNLTDYPADELHVTIPDFHDTRKRYEKLLQDIRENTLGKVVEVRSEIDWLLSVQDMACRLTDLYNEGRLPLRVTHNDTKINNVLFDCETKQALAVIDLDTVMPGLMGHDFGDAIRFAANFVEEDCPEAEKAGVNMDVFRAFAEGFLKYTARTLTQEEIDTLALSAFVLTVELATRFLDDYILGSPYFRTEYPEHNLVRTRCQIALAKDMLLHMDEMNAVVRECVAKYRQA